jgi:hypothetical protein
MFSGSRLRRTREATCVVLAYAAIAIICAFLPLADHLGFEFAAALTLVSAVAAPFIGFAAIRIERSLERWGAKAVDAGQADSEADGPAQVPSTQQANLPAARCDGRVIATRDLENRTTRERDPRSRVKFSGA